MNFLISLDLSNNQLTGEIPEHLAMGCVDLEYLLLSNNSLEGHIFPRNFNLTNLIKKVTIGWQSLQRRDPGKFV